MMNLLKIVNLAYLAAVVITLGFSSSILAQKENQTKGVLILNVCTKMNFVLASAKVIQLAGLQLRGLSIPNPLTTINVFSSFSSIGSMLESGAISAAGRASSAVTSAVGATESAIAQVIPKNITIGTKFVCAGYDTHSDCEPYPLNGSDSVSNLGAEFNPITSVLRHIPSLQVPIALGVGLAIPSACLGVLVLFDFCWALYVLMLCNVIGLALFITAAVYTKELSKLGSLVSGHVGITAEQGEVFSYLIVAAVFSSIAFVLGIVIWWRKRCHDASQDGNKSESTLNSTQ